MYLQFLQKFLQEDIEGHRPVYKSLVDSSNDLLESCSSVNVTDGVPEIKAETQDVVERWSAVNALFRERRDQVAEADTKAKKYRSILLPLENSVKKARKSLEESNYEGIDIADGEKELNAVKVNTTTLVNLKLENVK